VVGALLDNELAILAEQLETDMDSLFKKLLQAGLIVKRTEYIE
jgi:hypothetical protein